MLRGLGADLVGMSTAHEAIAAHHLGLGARDLARDQSCCGVSPTPLDHAEVLAAGAAAHHTWSGFLPGCSQSYDDRRGARSHLGEPARPSAGLDCGRSRPLHRQELKSSSRTATQPGAIEVREPSQLRDRWAARGARCGPGADEPARGAQNDRRCSSLDLDQGHGAATGESSSGAMPATDRGSSPSTWPRLPLPPAYAFAFFPDHFPLRSPHLPSSTLGRRLV